MCNVFVRKDTRVGEEDMSRKELEKLIADFVSKHNLDAQFVQQTEGLTYVRFVVEEEDDE